MKIYSNEEILKGSYPETKNRAQSTSGSEFGLILDETMANRSKVSSKTQATNFVAPTSGIQRALVSLPDKKLAVERLESLVDLLDRYREQLRNPHQTLKNIDPIIKEISAEKDDLSTIHEGLPGTDGLKAIANQILVTASLEIAKFYRGDYVAE